MGLFSGRLRESGSVNGITEGVIWKQLLNFFFPILLGSFFQQMYNTVDALIVGRYAGKLALAAVGSMGSFVNLLFGFFVGVASGATVILAQFCGARDEKRGSEAVHTGIAIALLGGAIITALGLLLAPKMLVVMDVPGDVSEDALKYISIFFSGMVFSVVYNIGSGIMRALGDSRRPLLFLIIGCFANVLLDLFFVAVLRLSVVGAAVATILSQLITALLVIISLMRRGDAYRLRLRSIRIAGGIMRGILHIGVPGGMQSVMYSVSNIIIQTAMNSFGSTIVAAWAVLGRVDGIVWLVMGAFGTAVTTFSGQNFGAQKYDRMRKSARICMVMAVFSTVAISTVVCLFPRALFGLFVDDAELLDAGVKMVRYITPYYITYVAVEILAGTIRGAGDTLKPMLIIAVCTCLFRVIWVRACMALTNDFKYVEISYPISWSITSIIFIIYYLRGKWLERRIKLMGYAPEIRRKAVRP